LKNNIKRKDIKKMVLSKEIHNKINEYVDKGSYNQIIINKDFVEYYVCKETLLKTVVINMKVLKYSLKSGCPLNAYLMEMIGVYGNITMLKYAHEELRCPHDRYTSAMIAERGNMGMLKYIMNSEFEIAENILQYGCKSKKLNIIKYLYEKGYKWDEYCAEMLVECGDIKMLKYAHKNGCILNVEASDKSIELKKIEMFKYMHKNNCEIGSTPTYHALFHDETGELHEYLLKTDSIEYDGFIMTEIVRSGDYERFELIPYDDEEMDIDKDYLCIDAVSGGSVEILEAVHKIGCLWSSMVTIEAASNGNIECLKYAVENGCELTRQALEVAEKRNHTRCVEYIRIKLNI
jgi:hypothetical protein